MTVKTGLDIINLYKEYADRINELEEVLANIDRYGYTKQVLTEQLTQLKSEVTALENTRFQPLEPVVIFKSWLGGNASS